MTERSILFNKKQVKNQQLDFLYPIFTRKFRSQKFGAKTLAVSIALLSAVPVWAASEPEDLQAEVTRLREKNAELNKALEAALGHPLTQDSARPAENIAAIIPVTDSSDNKNASTDSPQELWFAPRVPIHRQCLKMYRSQCRSFLVKSWRNF